MSHKRNSEIATSFAIAAALFAAGCYSDTENQTADAGATAKDTGAAGDGRGPELPVRCEGYTLFSMGAPYAVAVQAILNPDGPGPGAILVDMQGSIVHQWPSPGFPALMLPGGSLLGTAGNFPNTLATDELLQLDWDGEQQWSYSGWSLDESGEPSARQHHDYQREGNPVGYYSPGQPALAEGRTLVLGHEDLVAPELYPEPMLDDVIYEVDWQGNPTGFEWRGIDHFDEMGFDAAMKETMYGAQAVLGTFDWLHLNSVSRLGENRWYDAGDERFHPENILWSGRNTDTIAVISHDSGEIVWRVGPDYSEGRPEHALGIIIGQHHAHMIPRGLPGEGNILVFDNGGQSAYRYRADDPVASTRQRPWARVLEFDPVALSPVWQFGAQSGPEHMNSLAISSAQRLPNGNTLICVGLEGRIIEVTPDKQIVWTYHSPVEGNPITSAIYRAYRIPPEWLPEGENIAGYRPWAEVYGE